MMDQPARPDDAAQALSDDDRRLLAGGELPVRRPDLPARQPAPPRAAPARARQAATARPLGDDAGAQLHLRPPGAGDPVARPQRDLDRRPRSWRPGRGRECLPRGHLQRGLPRHLARRGGPARAVPPVLVPGWGRQPCHAGDAREHPRGRRARLRPQSCLRCGLRRPGSRGLLRDRRRRGRTATRSPTRRSSPGSPNRSSSSSSAAMATSRTSCPATSRPRSTSGWRGSSTSCATGSPRSSAAPASTAMTSGRTGR